MGQCLFVNHHGKGFAERRNIGEGETVSQFLHRSLPGVNLNDFSIRLNNQDVVEANTILQDGDRVTAISLDAVLPDNSKLSVAPKNMPGAIRWVQRFADWLVFRN